MQNPNCLRCQAQMELGVIADSTYGGNAQPSWAEGKPETSFWFGLIVDGKTTHPIQTFRCPSCGYLESYAIDEASA